jgi:2-polyprenyl-3-methyl-5-hydroxy-6-metoxy-1,4-benzoquinol methylase
MTRSQTRKQRAKSRPILAAAEPRTLPAPPTVRRIPRVAPPLAGADFSRREYDLRELMDEPSTFEDYSLAALDLAQVNRLTRGIQPTLDFLARVIARTGVGHQPLHIVDVGYASGDTLRSIASWAAQRSVPLRLTGVDIHPYAARLARAMSRRQHIPPGTITWRTADVFAANLDHPPDIILCSLFTHHLDDASIVRFLAWCEHNARVGWMINDLERSSNAATWFGRLAWLLRWHRFVRYDGPVSFRRAFSREDWIGYLAAANIHDARVYASRPARLCVERIKI